MSDPGAAALPDGGVLSYALAGDGEPVLLVRPLGGSMALWGRFREALAARFRVVSFDPRGAGRSSAAPLGHSTAAMARDAAALLDHLQIDAAHVFGLSLGGMVATWLAIDHEPRVRRLVLAATLPRGLAVSPRGAARGLGFAPCLARPAREAEVCLARRVLSRHFRREFPDEVKRIELVLRAEPASKAGLLALAAAAASHDATSRLGDVRATTLLLVGERDHIVGPGPRGAMRRALPGAAFDVIPGSGHDLTLERPDETAGRVMRFFAGGV